VQQLEEVATVSVPKKKRKETNPSGVWTSSFFFPNCELVIVG
jgi:hypothetical protein